MTISPHHLLVTHAARIVAAPLHVYVTDFPPSDPWAKVGAVAALVALTVAIATLVAVGCQIWIGRQELEAVQEDLANNKRLIDDAFRRPNLNATFLQRNERAQAWNGRVCLRNQVVATIYNDGARPALHTKLEFLVPAAIVYRGEEEPMDPNEVLVLREVNGKIYHAQEFFMPLPSDDGDESSSTPYVLFSNSHGILYPDSDAIVTWCRFLLPTPPRLESFTCLWRLYDEYGFYPKPTGDCPDPSNYFGRVTATAMWLQDGNSIKMEPAND